MQKQRARELNQHFDYHNILQEFNCKNDETGNQTGNLSITVSNCKNIRMQKHLARVSKQETFNFQFKLQKAQMQKRRAGKSNQQPFDL